MTRVGLISDTHGLLRPEAVRGLQGVDRILHAGDVGGARVLSELKRIAPVTAVRGNMDAGPWAGTLPLTAEVEINDTWIHMLHIVDELALDPSAAGFAAVIHGHSHRPSVERRKGVWFINPGSAGPRRFRLPITMARMRIDGGELEVEIVRLEGERR